MSINGAQSVRLEKGTTDFKNYSKKIPVPFKFHADFESNLESLEICEGFYSKRYHDHIPCSLADKHVCVDNKFMKLIVAFRGKSTSFIFVEAIIKEY